MGLEAYAEAVYPLHHFGWSDLRALRQGRYKLIAAPRPELYDLQDDPTETTNLFAARKALGDRMLGAARRDGSAFQDVARRPRARRSRSIPTRRRGWRRSATSGPSSPASPDDGSRAGLADPKDKVHLFNTITQARDLAKDEKCVPAAMAMLEEVLKEDPKVIDAWFTLGNMAGRPGPDGRRSGTTSARSRSKPDDEEAVINMAHAYRKLGRDDDALVGYQRFLELDPKNAQVRYEIAQIMIDRGEFATATAELRRR